MPNLVTQRSKQRPFAPIFVSGLRKGLTWGAAHKVAIRFARRMLRGTELRGFDYRAFYYDADTGGAMFT